MTSVSTLKTSKTCKLWKKWGKLVEYNTELKYNTGKKENIKVTKAGSLKTINKLLSPYSYQCKWETWETVCTTLIRDIELL